MQAVILAAGQSSRFEPFNKSGHKSSIRLFGKTILEHTLSSIKKAGITDVIVVVHDESELKKVVGSGKELDLNVKFVHQPEPLGMGDALERVKPHIKGSFFLLHASHIDFHEFAKDMMRKQKSHESLVLLAKRTEDVSEMGVLRIKGEKVVDVVEKPPKGTEPSHLRIIGIYLLPQTFFTSLTNVTKEHYSFESSISTYAKNHDVYYQETEKEVISLKYAWQLLNISSYLFSHTNPSIAKTAEISKTAIIEGDVTIGGNTKIMEGACIKGPVFIGPNCVIGNNSLLRNGTVVEEGSTIGAFSEVRNSIILKETSLHSGFVGDSIVGEHCKIGAGIITANVRIDRDHVSFTVKDKKMKSGVKALGVIIGHDTRLGVRVTTMPGVIIGSGSQIGPSTTVMKNVKEHTKLFTSFSETVEEVS